MGCGTSKTIDIAGAESSENSLTKSDNLNDPSLDGVFVPEVMLPEKSLEIYSCQENTVIKPKTEFPESNNSSVFQRSCSIASNDYSEQCPPKLSFEKCLDSAKRKSETELQERIQILTERRRQKNELEANGSLTMNGSANGNLVCNGSKEHCGSNSTPEVKNSNSPRIKPSFPTCQDTPSPKGSPFGQRNRLKLTDSQREFFMMLDEKIAQGRDYCSEDEMSISSLVSRQSTGKFSSRRLLSPLRLQHAR